MLVVAGGEGTRLDTGSIALAIARRLSESGRKVLFVDADTTGSRLVQRCGQALGASFSPAIRGLPTMITAGDPLRADTLAAHCYSLGAGPESLWLLFAPESAAGGRVAAGWLAEHVAGLREFNRARQVVVSAPTWRQHDTLLPLLRSASVLIHHECVENEEVAAALASLLDSVGLTTDRKRPAMLLVEQGSAPEDNRLQMSSGMWVVGRLPFVADDNILRMRFRGRGAAFATCLDKVVGILAAGTDGGAWAGSVTVLQRGRPAGSPSPSEPESARQSRFSWQRRTRDVSA